jgi:hypothetical protein
MTFPTVKLTRAVRAAGRTDDPVCLLCRKDVRRDEQRLRLRGETYVHRRCATYRMRNVRSGRSRVGFPG